ncbi:hypothetical protein Rhe02_09850 [Rhizocola hellebori]|uniref:Uncharacterized protein n=1 Tax=Rhizocola hellebori TaxID=1392758 RepID=A0A8J3Q3Z4_9ACTN|nr:hypothetical protein [Rhizocola hellebori]GIH02918.1 hypothetical protein Rhe02_09850 [Rhizocola hellebori]
MYPEMFGDVDVLITAALFGIALWVGIGAIFLGKGMADSTKSVLATLEEMRRKSAAALEAPALVDTGEVLRQIMVDVNRLRRQATSSTRRTFWAGLLLGLPIGVLVNWLSSLLGIGG